MTPVDPLAVAQLVAEILERHDIGYVIGGSVASSVMGEPRSTLDIDLMIDADVEKVRALVRDLATSCYVDEESASEAAARGTSFNAIHYASSMKIDFFIAERTDLARAQLRRGKRISLRSGASLVFYAAEDLVVRKLLWYRAGGETSERQWRDVLGVLRASNETLDHELLRSAAEDAGVSDLLDSALRESI